MEHRLIVVDLQHDFCHPDGSLYVKGGETIIPKISGIIPHFDETIFTVDFHPTNHCSFDVNGGQWPVHCVRYTLGASVPFELIDRTNSKCDFFRKGTLSYREEYGAFEDALIIDSDEDYIVEGIKHQDSDYVVCGIAGDYCVLETIKNLLKLVPKERVFVFMEGIVSMDGGTKLYDFIKENNLKIY